MKIYKQSNKLMGGGGRQRELLGLGTRQIQRKMKLQKIKNTELTLETF